MNFEPQINKKTNHFGGEMCGGSRYYVYIYIYTCLNIMISTVYKFNLGTCKADRRKNMEKLA